MSLQATAQKGGSGASLGEGLCEAPAQTPRALGRIPASPNKGSGEGWPRRAADQSAQDHDARAAGAAGGRQGRLQPRRGLQPARLLCEELTPKLPRAASPPVGGSWTCPGAYACVPECEGTCGWVSMRECALKMCVSVRLCELERVGMGLYTRGMSQ